MLCADRKMAGVEGVEPSQTEPESVVLPLYDTPSAFPDARVAFPQRLSASEYIRDDLPVRQPLFRYFLKKVGNRRVSAKTPHVVEGTRALAEIQTGRQRASHILLRLRHRTGKVFPLG